jgi:hypothetical protein
MRRALANKKPVFAALGRLPKGSVDFTISQFFSAAAVVVRDLDESSLDIGALSEFALSAYEHVQHGGLCCTLVLQRGLTAVLVLLRFAHLFRAGEPRVELLVGTAIPAILSARHLFFTTGSCAASRRS